MAERSFKAEVEQLRLSAGQEFRGEGILAVTKALLQAGVAYVGGYQGAPISHLMDVFADAADLLKELGVHFETSASEAAAAAMCAASVNYPLRGAVAWKSVVGTNVASDALSNVASGGVTGGVMVIVGEDYGEGSSIMQERTHAFAMKSQMWLLDPRPNLPSIVGMVEKGFELSEASHTPVMLELRVRACHVHGRFIAKDNVPPRFTVQHAANDPVRDTERIVLPPANFLHEREKIESRWPAAVRFVQDNKLNEHFGPKDGEIGIIVQGGLFNTLNRALELMDLSDVYGNAKLPVYVLNVTYPLIPDEVRDFCAGKRAVLIVEEGQPEFIEHELNTILRRADLQTRIVGKEILPRAGEYTAQVLGDGLAKFLGTEKQAAVPVSASAPRPPSAPVLTALDVPQRPAGFCTGCPERPLFTALKLVQRELGQHHVSADIGCHLFSILPPFNIGNTTMGYGLGTAGASAFRRQDGKRPIAVMGDGGFWHNGLTSGIGNAVFNRDDSLTIVVDNGYSAATGGQDLLSSDAANDNRSTRHAIETAVRGIGVTWVKAIDDTYDVLRMRDTLRQALTSKDRGPKVIVAQSECMLNKQRRTRPLFAKAVKDGRRAIRERFGVDAETCTGDHACIRLSGCPSLTIKPNPDPLKSDPVAHVDNSCVGCGLCGEVSHAEVLCPSFYKVQIVFNPNWWDRATAAVRARVIGWLR
ncbi:MAG: indolepyruvate ferredoxin oxidoreductase subunit alpha [Alphaproteobacteria bacterium]|nr:indolepyruvate ferredoxin oxidoreductase subunit alpha [Alphaproteobacteria bacterium]